MNDRSRRLTYAALGGCFAGITTWMALAPPFLVGLFSHLEGRFYILLMPGISIGFAASGNVHYADTWIVALGNAVFYFSVIYIVHALVAKMRGSRRINMASKLP